MVDVSMADGALSWLAMVAGAYFADGEVPRRGEIMLAGSLVCYRPYECADGWVSLGALEPKFWQAWCRGVGREDLIAVQFERPGSRGPRAGRGDLPRPHAGRVGGLRPREHDCCLEPVLELDEALDSDLVRERRMVVELDQPGAPRGRSASWGSPSSWTGRRAITRACPALPWASTRPRSSRVPATAPRRSPSCSPREPPRGLAETVHATNIRA